MRCTNILGLTVKSLTPRGLHRLQIKTAHGTQVNVNLTYLSMGLTSIPPAFKQANFLTRIEVGLAGDVTTSRLLRAA